MQSVRRYSFPLMMLIMLLAFSTNSAFGHGLGFDTSLPITISNRQISVDATIKPTFIEQVSGSSPTFVVRALEGTTLNSPIAGIDFRILVQLKNETLLDQRFRTSDGVVAANLIPATDIDAWEINGQPGSGDQVPVSLNKPVELKSKILTAGGLYHIVATIESSSPGIAIESDRRFDLYISIGRTYTYNVQGGMVVKTYYDEITTFEYSNSTISFETPFTWDAAYIAQVPVLHMEVQFPKTVEELQTNSYSGTLNGKELPAQAMVIDDYTSEQNRTVHFVVNNAVLSRFADAMKDTDVAAFALKPADKPKFPFDIMSIPGERFLFQLSWGPDLIETGTPVTFVMNLQDPATGDLIRGSSFDLVLTQAGSEIHRQHLSSDFGTYSYKYTFANAGMVTLSASDINSQGESAKIDLAVLPGSGEHAPNPPQQPSGCLIATAAFGSELTPQVQYLRHFRDQFILSTVSGSAFMNSFNSVYYSFSPQVADYERQQPWLQTTMKAALYPLFGILTVAEQSYATVGGEAGAILAGATVSALIGVVYLMPVGYLIRNRIDGKFLIMIIGVTIAFLAVTLVALPVFLQISTTAFVIATTGSSAIFAAKAMCRLFRLETV